MQNKEARFFVRLIIAISTCIWALVGFRVLLGCLQDHVPYSQSSKYLGSQIRLEPGWLPSDPLMFADVSDVVMLLEDTSHTCRLAESQTELLLPVVNLPDLMLAATSRPIVHTTLCCPCTIDLTAAGE